jgi:hypothetical protein
MQDDSKMGYDFGAISSIVYLNEGPFHENNTLEVIYFMKHKLSQTRDFSD